MTERRCRGCGFFYDKRDHACPECGTLPYAYNVHLVASRWSSALNEKAYRAEKEA